jgi:uncharacterized protein DUF1479
MTTTELPANMSEAISRTKRELRARIGDVAGAFTEVREAMRREVDAVAADPDAFPVVRYRDIADGTVPQRTLDAVRRRGCAVVKGTFARETAEAWDAELAAYLADNDFAGTYQGPADDVFAGLSSSQPQI